MRLKYQILLLILLFGSNMLKCQMDTVYLDPSNFWEEGYKMKFSVYDNLESGSTDTLEMYINTIIVFKGLRTFSISLLSNQERVFLLFYLKKYDILLKEILESNHYFIWENRAFGSSYAFYPLLIGDKWEFWQNYGEKIKEEISASDLSEDYKKLLILYWENIMINLDEPLAITYNYDSLNTISNELINNSNIQPYDYFIRRYLRHEYTKGNWGVGIGLSPFGNSYLSNDLKDYFINANVGGEDFEVYYKKWLFSFNWYLLNTDLNRNINSTWNTSGEIVNWNTGLNIGYTLLDLKRIRIIPTSGLALGRIKYMENDSTIDKIKGLIQPKIAMIVDIKFNLPYSWWRKKHQIRYLKDIHEEYYFIRLCGGIHPYGFNNKFEMDGNIWYFKIGIGAFIRPAKRIIK